MGYHGIPFLEAQLFFADRSGFPGDFYIAANYALSGPALGARQLIDQPPESPVMVGPGDIVDLVEGLRLRSGDDWAVAVIDDGAQFVATNNRGAAYISPGVRLPYNVGLISGNDQNDGVFWRVYGWPPAERLVAYAHAYGWLDQITMLATSTRACVSCGVDEDAFAWVRAFLGSTQLIQSSGHRYDPHRTHPWGCALLAGSRHRLELTAPARYKLLATQVCCRHEDAVLDDLARATIGAAQTAIVHGARSFDADSSGGSAQKQILEIVAATDPSDIVDRRLKTLSLPGEVSIGDNTAEAVGLPAEAAPAWAYEVDSAYFAARVQRRRTACSQYSTVRYTAAPYRRIHAAADDLAEALNAYVSAELVAVALEAVLFWCADPLPVADIAYAAGGYAATAAVEDVKPA